MNRLYVHCGVEHIHIHSIIFVRGLASRRTPRRPCMHIDAAQCDEGHTGGHTPPRTGVPSPWGDRMAGICSELLLRSSPSIHLWPDDGVPCSLISRMQASTHWEPGYSSTCAEVWITPTCTTHMHSMCPRAARNSEHPHSRCIG